MAESITETPRGRGSGLVVVVVVVDAPPPPVPAPAAMGFPSDIMKIELGSCSSAPEPAAELVCSCSSTLWWSVSSSHEPSRMQSSRWHMERRREVVVTARLSASVNSVTSSFSRELRLPVEARVVEHQKIYTHYTFVQEYDVAIQVDLVKGQ